MKEQFWLAELDQHGNPDLIDGAHDSIEGVEQAAYLLARLGLVAHGKRFAAARVEISEVAPQAHGINEEAIDTLNAVRVCLKGGDKR
jgi:hypothetical protein